MAPSVATAAGRPVDHGAAAAEDPRTPIKLPYMRGAFLEHMRHHMDSLDDVMAQLATADFKGAKVCLLYTSPSPRDS